MKNNDQPVTKNFCKVGEPSLLNTSSDEDDDEGGSGGKGNRLYPANEVFQALVNQQQEGLEASANKESAEATKNNTKQEKAQVQPSIEHPKQQSTDQHSLPSDTKQVATSTKQTSANRGANNASQSFHATSGYKTGRSLFCPPLTQSTQSAKQPSTTLHQKTHNKSGQSSQHAKQPSSNHPLQGQSGLSVTNAQVQASQQGPGAHLPTKIATGMFNARSVSSSAANAASSNNTLVARAISGLSK